jgi:hypothetical protein
MWKPVSIEGVVDIAVVMAIMKAMKTALLNLSNVVFAQMVATNSIAGEQRVNKWMNVANVFVGVVCFVATCMLVYNNA